MSQKNTKIVTEFIEEVWNRKNLGEDSFYAFSKHANFRSFVGKSFGLPTFRETVTNWLSAFRDFHAVFDLQEHDNIVTGIVKCKETYLQQYKHTGNDLGFSHLPSFILKGLLKTPPKEQTLYHPVRITMLFDRRKIIWCDIAGCNLPQFAQMMGFDTDSMIKEQTAYLQKELMESFISIYSEEEVQLLALHLFGLPLDKILFSSQSKVQQIINIAFEKMGCRNKKGCLEKMLDAELLPSLRELGFLIYQQIVASPKTHHILSGKFQG